MYDFNPVMPTVPSDYDLDSGYWDEVDRYVNEYLLLLDVIDKKKEKETREKCLYTTN